MRVRELIEALKREDPSAEVVVLVPRTWGPPVPDYVGSVESHLYFEDDGYPAWGGQSWPTLKAVLIRPRGGRPDTDDSAPLRPADGPEGTPPPVDTSEASEPVSGPSDASLDGLFDL